MPKKKIKLQLNLSDGTTREIIISPEDKEFWMGVFEPKRAAEHRNEAEKGGAEVEPIYVPCLNCDTARSVIAGIMQRCPNCGDDEIDIWQEAEIP